MSAIWITFAALCGSLVLLWLSRRSQGGFAYVWLSLASLMAVGAAGVMATNG
jgi:hypothetical protein